MRKHSTLTVAVTAALLGLLCGCKPRVSEPAKHTPLLAAVQVTQSKRGPITRSVTLPAVIRAEQHVTLYAKVGGYVKSINVDRGDAVKEGDVIAEIEAPELLADQASIKLRRAQGSAAEGARLGSATPCRHGERQTRR